MIDVYKKPIPHLLVTFFSMDIFRIDRIDLPAVISPANVSSW